MCVCVFVCMGVGVSRFEELCIQCVSDFTFPCYRVHVSVYIIAMPMMPILSQRDSRIVQINHPQLGGYTTHEEGKKEEKGKERWGGERK